MNLSLVSLVLCSGLACVTAEPALAQPKNVALSFAFKMGCGNIEPQEHDYNESKMKALQISGTKICRINIYPRYYEGNGNAVHADIDTTVLRARKYGLRPYFLFNYYGMYWNRDKIKLGSKERWQNIGKNFATRYKPNSAWFKSQNIANWGVELWAAFNEPDLEHFSKLGNNDWLWIPATSADPNSAPDTFDGNYRDALEGFADGVHSASTRLKVINGGFMAQNAFRDYTCGGYATAIADLFNSGKLNGLNLHTYNDAQWAPLFSEGIANESSAYRQFREVKRASGIKSDPDFYTDEFNYKNPERDDGKSQVNDERTARNLLTMIWTNMGVVKDDGKTPATQMLMLWSLFPVESTYTTAESLDPYVPRLPAKTYSFVAKITNDLKFSSLDPFGSGEFVMQSKTRKLWAWINAPGYSNKSGTSYVVTNIPRTAKKLELFGWDGFNGPRKTVTLKGQSSVTFDNLATGETYMILAS
jgi:hypothetical protein